MVATKGTKFGNGLPNGSSNVRALMGSWEKRASKFAPPDIARLASSPTSSINGNAISPDKLLESTHPPQGTSGKNVSPRSLVQSTLTKANIDSSLTTTPFESSDKCVKKKILPTHVAQKISTPSATQDQAAIPLKNVSVLNRYIPVISTTPTEAPFRKTAKEPTTQTSQSYSRSIVLDRYPVGKSSSSQVGSCGDAIGPSRRRVSAVGDTSIKSVPPNNKPKEKGSSSVLDRYPARKRNGVPRDASIASQSSERRTVEGKVSVAGSSVLDRYPVGRKSLETQAPKQNSQFSSGKRASIADQSYLETRRQSQGGKRSVLDRYNPNSPKNLSLSVADSATSDCDALGIDIQTPAQPEHNRSSPTSSLPQSSSTIGAVSTIPVSISNNKSSAEKFPSPPMSPTRSDSESSSIEKRSPSSSSHQRDHDQSIVSVPETRTQALEEMEEELEQPDGDPCPFDEASQDLNSSMEDSPTKSEATSLLEFPISPQSSDKNIFAKDTPKYRSKFSTTSTSTQVTEQCTLNSSKSGNGQNLEQRKVVSKSGNSSNTRLEFPLVQSRWLEAEIVKPQGDNQKPPILKAQPPADNAPIGQVISKSEDSPAESTHPDPQPVILSSDPSNANEYKSLECLDNKPHVDESDATGGGIGFIGKEKGDLADQPETESNSQAALEKSSQTSSQSPDSKEKMISMEKQNRKTETISSVSQRIKVLRQVQSKQESPLESSIQQPIQSTNLIHTNKERNKNEEPMPLNHKKELVGTDMKMPLDVIIEEHESTQASSEVEEMTPVAQESNSEKDVSPRALKVKSIAPLHVENELQLQGAGQDTKEMKANVCATPTAGMVLPPINLTYELSQEEERGGGGERLENCGEMNFYADEMSHMVLFAKPSVDGVLGLGLMQRENDWRIIISSMSPDGLLHDSNLRVGQTLLAVNGIAANDFATVKAVASNLKAAKNIAIVATKSVIVTLQGNEEEDPIVSDDKVPFGLTLGTIQKDGKSYLVITDITPDSEADYTETLEVGMKVIALNDHTRLSIEEASHMLHNSKTVTILAVHDDLLAYQGHRNGGDVHVPSSSYTTGRLSLHTGEMSVLARVPKIDCIQDNKELCVSGIAFMERTIDWRIVISYIAKDGPFANSGLQVGQTLLAVNGIPSSNFRSSQDVRTALNHPPSKEGVVEILATRSILAFVHKTNANSPVGIAFCEKKRDGILSIDRITPDGLFGQNGLLQVGMNVISINGQDCNTLEHAKSIIKECVGELTIIAVPEDGGLANNAQSISAVAGVASRKVETPTQKGTAPTSIISTQDCGGLTSKDETGTVSMSNKLECITTQKMGETMGTSSCPAKEEEPVCQREDIRASSWFRYRNVGILSG